MTTEEIKQAPVVAKFGKKTTDAVATPAVVEPVQQVAATSDIVAQTSAEDSDADAHVDTLLIVTVPRPFLLRLSNTELLEIRQGVQKMSSEIANHWYSIANGVEIFKD